MQTVIVILYPVVMLAVLVWIHIEVTRASPSRAFCAVAATWDAIRTAVTPPINWILRRMPRPT